MRERFKKIGISLLAAALLAPAFAHVPKSSAAADPSVTLQQSFEDGDLGGWGKLPWGPNGVAVVSSANASEGSKSLQFKDRESTTDDKGNVTASTPSLDLTGKMLPGHTYDLSLKVRLGSGKAEYHVASKVDSPLLSNQYPWLIGNKSVSSTEWTTFALSGYEIPDQTKEVRIWIEPASGDKADLFIDEVLVKDVTPSSADEPDSSTLDQTGVQSDFENGLQGWVARNGSETVAIASEDNHSPNGSKSLKVTAPGQYDAALLDVLGKMHKNSQYQLSAWVKMAPGQAPTVLRISVQNGEGSYANVSQNATVTDSAWVQLTGKYTQTSTPSLLKAYIETADQNGEPRTFYLDDFKLEYVGKVSGPTSIQTNIPSIKDVYQNDFLIGNAGSARDFEGLPFELLKKHYNVITAENAMKPDATQPTKGNFTWADNFVDKAIASGLKVHGHVLVWHAQTPDWMNTKKDAQDKTVPLSREEALDNMRTHIRTVMEHYGNRVISWDVVNEAMNDNPSNPTDWKAALRTAPWKTAIGDDYVEQAFLAAREVLDAHPDWNIKLYYNDYNDDNQNKATAIYSMVKELNENYAKTHSGKLLIDGIGMQAHYNAGTKVDNVRSSLEKFISLGVEISVSELDITGGSNGALTEKEANAQAYLYAQLFALYHEHAAHIARVTFWGLSDETSWRKDQSPLAFDKNLQAKPAYYGVIDPAKFMSEHPPASTTANQANAKFATPVIDGKIDSAWKQAAELPINRYQTAWTGASGWAKALWDDQFLYVLVQVNDHELDKTSPNPWEQDSVEVFVDQNNGKTAAYEEDDGQYRVRYDNATSFNPASIADGFVSATQVSGTNYTIEMKIPLKSIKPADGTKVGFDVQINDAKNGARQSVAAWNDTTGQGYQDPSVFGVLTLTGTAPFAWAKGAIEAMTARGIHLGTSDKAFEPNAAMNKSEFLSLLVRALELHGTNDATEMFSDVKASASYYDAVKTAKQLGIIQGTSNDLFLPDSPITRQEMMVLVARAAKAAGKTLPSNGSLDTFEDAASVAEYARDSVASLVKAGIVQGANGKLAPNGVLTGAEAVVILQRLWSK
ncbi:endo-1,4-beta-xylanase [Cohnella sp. AR92]|uniref:endo-1,4-beta-xylanase n=1 Tax=Cohnella sp. AR92 TaxID=648716 RepID=UPI000F8DB8B9|nr:endo-1,4-beta-xylanase [Cohnella sp. AR92]RUS42453.1 glycoside hydrolase [Cohnella sp. AR92]